MLLSPRLVLLSMVLSFGVSAGWCADAMMTEWTEWKDPKGAVFRGEPIEALGPLALFRTGATSSKFLPMRALEPEDCVRFHQAVAGRPARAAKWSEAKGRATGEFVGRLVRLEGGKLNPVDLTRMPEPELLIVLFRSGQGGGSWRMFDNLSPFISRIQRVYPGRVATVMMSTWDAGRGGGQALPSGRNWLVADPKKQADMKLMSRFVPAGGFVMMLMTREGVPLFGAPANDVTEVMRFVDGASDMLWQLNPANPRTARDRAHYLKVVRPVEFAAGKTGPLLLADMFRVEGLRQNGIGRIEARIAVAADGKVEGVELLPEAEIPAPLRPAMNEAIRRSAAFVPAVENGVAVAGTYEYSFKVGPENKQLAADAAWVNGEARVELPLKSWLVLKAVKVPEQVFGSIDRVGADGTVMMKAVTAGDPNKISRASQVNSFNNDWFSEAGAGSVQPKEGDKQEIEGNKLKWKRMVPRDGGLVDFLDGASPGSFDYCIGYAWTEVEVATDTDAWLGIGSDDGLKIWVNGELVNDQWLARSSRLDEDVVPLKLKKGKNQILIKIQNVKIQWSFTARLRVRGT